MKRTNVPNRMVLDPVCGYGAGAVKNEPEGREGMALGRYAAGMGFSKAGLGIVRSMAR